MTLMTLVNRMWCAATRSSGPRTPEPIVVLARVQDGRIERYGYAGR
ncbi:MAG: hypothetical protein ACT4OX_11890 [Actinomycetota bacterium]